MTKSQVIRKMNEVGIKGQVSGKGQDFTVEVNAKDAAKFRRLVAKLSGFKTGYGAWVFNSQFTPSADDNICTQPKPETTREMEARGVSASRIGDLLDKGAFLNA